MPSPRGVRYFKRGTIFNSFPEYSKQLNARNKFGILQYATPKLQRVDYYDMSRLDTLTHIWTFGDRYYKLADRYYGNSTVWWVIAFLNQKPTEAHCNLGDNIVIYTPLRDVLLQLGVY